MNDSKNEIMESLLAAFPAWTVDAYVHWSAHVSLYSAKTRSYMVKKGSDKLTSGIGDNQQSPVKQLPYSTH